MTLSYVVYTHSSYNDVFTVQNDYYKDIKETKYLFIDKINNDIKYNFDKIIIYNDNLNYTKRLLSCFLQADIKDEYIIYNPDINIFIKKNDDDIYNLVKIMKKNEIDRLDFCCYKFINNNENVIYNDYILVYNNDLSNYIFNVGTAIYNLKNYINLLDKFDYEYRTSELKEDLQKYALDNMKCYYINHIDPTKIISTGYYGLTDIFVYIHITHYGELMPIDNNLNNTDIHIQKIYEQIINNYKFNRNMKTSMH
jgi:hypothetical protein